MLRAISYTGELLGNIDFIEASWDRKWGEPGEFMAWLPLAEYMRLDALGMKYVENIGRPETGVIQKTEYSRETDGAFVTVSGHFAEAFLNFGAYRKTQVISAAAPAAVKNAVVSYMDNCVAAVPVDGMAYKPLKSVAVDPASVFPTAADSSIDPDMQMGEAIYSVLSGSGHGLAASISEYPALDGTGGVGLNLVFRKGEQKTEGDSGVFFGKAYNNVDDMRYTLDESAECCLYEVLQEVGAEYYNSFSAAYFPIKFTETQDGETKHYIGCTYFYKGNQPSKIGECYPKRVLKTSLSSDECDLKVTTAANQQKIRNLMQKKAQLDMLDHYKVEAISANVIQERFFYMQDYDLGDVCAVLIDDLGQLYHARIEEVNETHKDNRIDVELVLGTPSRQKWRK